MQVLLHLPDNIALRLKKAIPAKKRSAFICNLLEQALPDFEEELFNLAILANQDDDKNFNENISLDNTNLDGLDKNEIFDLSKLEELCKK